MKEPKLKRCQMEYEVRVPDLSLMKQKPHSPTPTSCSLGCQTWVGQDSSGHLSPEPKKVPLTSQAYHDRTSGCRASTGRINKFFGKRSRSQGKSSHRPYHPVIKVKQSERENHPCRRREERQPREPWEQRHRLERNGDRDSQHSHPNQRKSSSGQNRDAQNLLGEAENKFENFKRVEHSQKRNVRGSNAENPEIVAQLAGRDNKEKDPTNKEKPTFELSGALVGNTNMFRGTVIKYNEPPEAWKPKKRWRLYPFKNDKVLPIMFIHRQSAYLQGRHQGIADIPIDHPSCSKLHAVFQYRLVEYIRADGTTGRRVQPYIIDLGSGNGTFLNNQHIEPQRYYELKEKDVLKFGFSSREYVLLHESSDISKADGKEEKEEDISDS